MDDLTSDISEGGGRWDDMALGSLRDRAALVSSTRFVVVGTDESGCDDGGDPRRFVPSVTCGDWRRVRLQFLSFLGNPRTSRNIRRLLSDSHSAVLRLTLQGYR